MDRNIILNLICKIVTLVVHVFSTLKSFITKHDETVIVEIEKPSVLQNVEKWAQSFFTEFQNQKQLDLVHQNTNGCNALMLYLQYAKPIDPMMIPKLVGPKINVTDKDGYSALMYAVFEKAPLQVIQTLVNQGADVNHINMYGRSMMNEYLYNNEDGRVDPKCQLLLRAGFNCRMLQAEDLDKIRNVVV